jgi:hypothetical protein
MSLRPSAETLPRRHGPRPRTHKNPPHTQLDAVPVARLISELARRCFQLDGVVERPTRISVPGARALVAAEGLTVNRGALMIEGEFAHIHPDGSMHVILAEGMAARAIEAGWAEHHPMARHFHPGMVMLYTPRDEAELEVLWRLVLECWRYVFENGDQGLIDE